MSELSLIFSDDTLLVVNKPAMMHSVSHAEGDGSIASKLLSQYPELAEVADQKGDAGLINRLDFETSGILIAVRNQEAWRALRDQFQRHEIKKTYIALVEGAPALPKVIEGYIGNRYRGSKKVTFQAKEEKRFLRTRSKLVALVRHDKDLNRSLIKIEASSGARHQVRVHCAEAGCPLVGDPLYNPKQEKLSPPFFLHAATCELKHPKSGERMLFEAPLPNYFQ